MCAPPEGRIPASTPRLLTIRIKRNIINVMVRIQVVCDGAHLGRYKCDGAHLGRNVMVRI